MWNRTPQCYRNAVVIMAALWNRAGHCIFVLWFHLSFFFFSSPILSRRRLDVCLTSSHGVALVRIYDSSLKCGTRSSLKIQDAKNRQKFAICAPLHNFAGAISSQLRHISAIRTIFLNSNISPTCPHNMVNFGALAAEIRWRVWGTPANFNGFRVLASLLQ